MGEGQLLARAMPAPAGNPFMVSVMAEENTEVLFLEVGRLLTVCSMACRFHSRVIQNLLKVIAGRNLTLTTKIDHMSKNDTGKSAVLSFLPG